jgi:hypothetical protein
LRQYQVLDTAAEQVFDDITKMAAEVCQTPRRIKKLVESILPSAVFDVESRRGQPTTPPKRSESYTLEKKIPTIRSWPS